MNLHPKIGKWKTIGLCGNMYANNSIFYKHIILLKFFKNFYKFKKNKLIKNKVKTYNRIYSYANTFITNISSFFENRLDITIFRSNFAINLDFARLLIKKYYIFLNDYQNSNIHFQVNIGDFFWIEKKFREIFLLFLTNKNNVHFVKNLYLQRFFKPIFFNHLSLKILKTFTNLTQMTEKNINFEHLSENYFILNNLKQHLTSKTYKIQPSLLFKQLKTANLISPSFFTTKLTRSFYWNHFFKKYFKTKYFKFDNIPNTTEIKKISLKKQKIIRNIYLKNFFLIKNWTKKKYNQNKI